MTHGLMREFQSIVMQTTHSRWTKARRATSKIIPNIQRCSVPGMIFSPVARGGGPVKKPKTLYLGALELHRPGIPQDVRYKVRDHKSAVSNDY